MIDDEIVNVLKEQEAKQIKHRMLNKLIQSTEGNNKKFKEELTNLLNRYGYDTTCDTPDYILADYIGKCLENYCAVIQSNIAWHTGWKRLGEEADK